MEAACRATQTTWSPNRHGLTADEAATRLRDEGPNLLPAPASRSQLRIVLEVLREPMLALLLAGGVAYMLLGSLAEALVLICFAGFSIVVTVVQESRTEHVLQSLRDLAAPRALVVRDGEPLRIPGRDVVRGDLLVIERGDRIAADATVIEATDLAADESLLTGESVPVTKRPLASSEDVTALVPGGDGQPLVYSGTMVTRGQGLAHVIATGPHSQIGRIGQSLTMLEMEAPGLRRQTLRIVQFSALGAAIITLAVVILFGLLRGGWLEAVLAGIAIGMSLLPEEFPVVLTVFLAMGAWRISRVGVLTRRAAAIETLGSATVLCADKTGTLTANRMTVTELWRPESGTLSLSDAVAIDGYEALLLTGALASATVPTDPMETALHDVTAARVGTDHRDWTLERSFGLTPELLAMSNAWDRGDGDGLVVAAKGAPEAIAELCRLSPADRDALAAAAREMAARGIRVLGVAQARVAQGQLGERQQDHPFALSGLIGLADPLRADVPAAIAQCRSAGIRVMMITGDHAATARAIATEAGILGGDVLTGPDIEAMSDDDLVRRLPGVSVCARTMPAQKLRIVNALKAAGEVVAMTGDGVNDAPALKSANIGIAMGKRGTDVAREAASIVLVEDDFGAIVAAIRLGRRIYDNIRKAMGFIFAVHVPIAGLALLPLVTGLPVLFGPIQIALLEMIIDPVCALFFEAEPEEQGIMDRRPRRPNEPLFSMPMIVRSVAQGAIAFLMLAALLFAAACRGMPAPEIRALVFFALVSAVIALVLVNRAFSRSIADALIRGNAVFRYIVGGVVIIGAIIIASPFVQDLLQFASLSAAELALALAIGALLLVTLEWTKLGARHAR
ncbi:cation-translocating P-type ATPase [Hephaestia mangrovi]|uniref:cation-translocating P-type ATPase n=1 Tax=Hephaestia mangrovi TaxID=2873268 RepID=UPI001CA75B47|nr:cation-translocating P-type ATPase [Hephaestia mangrovi]MBY8829424.1 cation-translocating P-type ATPase [Hephaestia mangrovi]